MKNNRRKASSRVKQPDTISALIEKQNIWSEWSAGCWIGPLSWVQMAALLMRDTRPEMIVNRLAPLLDRTRQEVEGKYRKWAKGAPAEPKFLTTYENYREHFQDELLEQFRGFLKTLEGNSDLEWLRDRLIASQAGAQSFVWFLLNGIAIAQIEGELDETCIKHDARWLAELDFYEPAYLAGDEAVLREFYETFRESFARAAPLPDKPSTSRSLECPIADSEDPYIERLAEIEARQNRQAAREYFSPSDPVDLPEDAWQRAMWANAWDSALNLAKVPMFGWQRQIAFMLRDVSLDEVALRSERVLLDMADLTDRNAIENAAARGHPPAGVGFGLWFKWWREHFRHWNDPLRTELERLCRSEDAGFVGDWLPRFDGAVFADFLITCAHARVIDNRYGFGARNERLLESELFTSESDGPLMVSDLHMMTIKLWGRFCSEHGIADSSGHLALDFEVDGGALLSSEQPHAVVRL